LPKVFVDAILRLVDDDTRGEAWHRDIEALSYGLVTTVVGPNGADEAGSLLARGLAPDAPAATELIVRSAM